MKKRQQNNTNSSDHQENFAEMTYDGKPLPKWLQKPAFQEQAEEKANQIPEWLSEPAKF